MSLSGGTKVSDGWWRKRWPAIRTRGFGRFLLVRGVMGYGGVMFLLITAMVTFQLGTDHPRLPLLIGFAAVLCAMGAAFWAAMTWWLNERFFRSLLSKNP